MLKLADAGFFVAPVNYHSELAALRAVRETVFVQEQQVPLELEWDALDPDSAHVLARDDNGRPIGTGRLTPEHKIGRMAVLAEWRGKGVGAALLLALIDEARRRGWEDVSLHAQVDAVGFYRRYGFEPYGERFVEAGIDHQSMRKTLEPMAARTPDATAAHASEPSQAVESLAEAVAAVLDIIANARTLLCLYSRDLDPDLFGRSDVLDALRTFATAHPGAELRVIVQEPERVVQNGHPLLTLAQRLSSHMALRAPTEPVDLQYAGAYLFSDQGGFYFRPLGARYEGEASVRRPARARQLRATFEPVWERCRECTEFRALAI